MILDAQLKPEASYKTMKVELHILATALDQTSFELDMERAAEDTQRFRIYLQKKHHNLEGEYIQRLSWQRRRLDNASTVGRTYYEQTLPH